MRHLVRSALSDPDDEPKNAKVNRKRYAGDVGHARSGSRRRDLESNSDDLDSDEERRVDDVIDVMADKILEMRSVMAAKEAEPTSAGEVWLDSGHKRFEAHFQLEQGFGQLSQYPLPITLTKRSGTCLGS